MTTTTPTQPIPQEFIQVVAKERGVTDAELLTVFMALGGQSTASIATELGISDIAVRKRLGEVYKKFQIGGSGPGKLAELRHQLSFLYQSGQPTSTPSYSPVSRLVPPSMVITQRHQDWGESPDLVTFYGREEELTALEEWILEDECRLIALLGLGGIGKTTLAVKLAKEIGSKFDFVVWRSLRSAPSVDHLLANLLLFFANQPKQDIPDDTNIRISFLLEYLRSHRCLLILDDFEMVLSSDNLAGRYRPGYEGYRELITRLGEVSHNSCLVLISSEEPTELTLLPKDKVQSLNPVGSEEIARELFQEQGLTTTDKNWRVLMERYGGNLLAYKIVASTIQQFFDGNVNSFLEATSLFIEDHIGHLLEHQLERLSTSEEEILYWLAIERTPLTLAKLRENLVTHSPLSDVLKNLDSLGRRSLIEKRTEAGKIVFTLQPLVMKYVTTQLVEELQTELLNLIRTQKLENLRLLKSHCFYGGKIVGKGKGAKATQVQGRLILGKIKNSLQVRFMKTKGYEEQVNTLTKICAILQDKSELEVGYAAENLQAILTELEG